MNYLRFLFLKGLLLAVPIVCFGYSENDKLTFDGINYKVKDAQNNTLSAVGASKAGPIEIPATIFDGKDITFTVTDISGEGNSWKGVTAVTLPNTIVSLSSSAFAGASITTLTLPRSLTSIDPYSFNVSFGSLSEIIVEEGNPVFKAEDGILYTVDGEQLVYVPDKKKMADGVFAISDGVKKVWRNSIKSNPNIKKIVIPASVTNIEIAWAPIGHSCYNFTAFEVNVGNQNYSSDGNGVLFDKEQSVLYSYPFGKKNTSYKVPDTVKEISMYGIYNYYLETLDFNKLEKLVSEAVFGCRSLTTVFIPKTLTDFDGGITACYNINKYVVEEGNPNYSSDNDGIVFNADKTSLVLFPPAKEGEYTVPSTVNTIEKNSFFYSNLISLFIPSSVQSIGNYAFRSMHNLESVTFEENSQVDEFKLGVFWGQNKLETITLPTSLKVLNTDAFYQCDNLKHVIVPDGSQLSKISTNTFRSCDNLETFEFQGSCTLKTISAGVFNNKTKLREFVFPASVTTIGNGAFLGCTSLTTATFPENAAIKTIGEGAFAGCGLTSFTVPTNVTTIDREAFRGCTALTGVSLSAKTQVIHPEAFKGCSNITEFVVDRDNPYYSTVKGMLCDKGKTTLVLFPQGQATEDVTMLPPSLTAIGNYAFYECEKLKGVVIPQKVTSIGKRAFGLCTNLESIAFLCDEMIDPANINQKQNEMSFDDGSQAADMYGNISLYVRKDLLDAYKNSAYYTKFKDGAEGIRSSFTMSRSIDGKQDEFMPLSNTAMSLLRTNATVSTYVAPLDVVNPEDGKSRSVNIIGDYAFEGSSVKEVVLLGEIRQLGAMAFVTDVTRNGNVPTANGSTITDIFFVGKTPTSYLNATDFELSEDFNEFLPNQNIYVKKSAADDYKSTWSKYANQIKYQIPGISINNKYGTFAREFDVDLSDYYSEKGSGRVYAFTATARGKSSGSGDYGESEYYVIMRSINEGQEGDGTYIPAGTGVLLKAMDNAPTTPPDFHYTIGEKDVNEAAASVLVGVTENSKQITDTDADIYVMSGGVFKPLNGQTITMPAHKAYLKLPESTGARVVFLFGDSQETVTGLDNLNAAPSDRQSPMYNLSGQRVSGSYKGIAIVEGKKYNKK